MDGRRRMILLPGNLESSSCSKYLKAPSSATARTPNLTGHSLFPEGYVLQAG